jgi:acetyl esterase/lipase
MRNFFSTLAIILVLTTACVPAKTEAQVFRDIAYANYPGTDPNLNSLDVYSPLGKEGCPVILWVHGGGWQIGDKTDLIEQKAQYFLSQNFVFVSTNYRLFPDAAFPVFVQDVASAIAWINDNIDQYGGDPQRIILVGFSSGAHIVTLLATDNDYLAEHHLQPDVIDAVVSVDSAAYDLPLLSKYYKGKLEGTHGFIFGNDPDIWKAASPITFLKKSSFVPPMLLVYSRGVYEDQVNPNFKEQAEHFSQVLQKYGDIVAIAPFQKLTHQQLDERLGLPFDPLKKEIMTFLRDTANLSLSCQPNNP